MQAKGKVRLFCTVALGHCLGRFALYESVYISYKLRVALNKKRKG
jgi:hypothetical protein